MFRRSSPRALISTRHTLCLPFSAASISAGTSGVSSLVRYTVAFRPITSGSLAAVRTNASKLVANVCLRDLREDHSRAGRETGMGDRYPRVLLQLGPVQLCELHRVGEIEQ